MDVSNKWQEFFFEELQNIYMTFDTENLSDNDCDRLEKTCKNVIELSNRARKGGVLSIEKWVTTAEIDGYDIDLNRMISQIVDGLEQNLLVEMSLYRYDAKQPAGIDALIFLLQLRGALAIQEGNNSRVLEEILRSMIPSDVKMDLFPEKKRFYDIEVDCKSIIRGLTGGDMAYDSEATEKWTLLGQLERTFVEADDETVQRILSHVENTYLSVLMKASTPFLNRRIFDNMSQRLSYMIAQDIEYMGPIRMVDVERAREEIAKLILKLADDGEISICNEKELKLILEVQESVGEQNKKMAAEYRRVSELIDAL